MSNVAPTRRLLALLYLVGFVVAADQIADLATTALLQPVTTGTASWRFAVFGMAASRASIFLIADVLLFLAAAGLGHRKMLRVFSVGHAALAIVLGIALGLFGLDALELQRSVRPDGKGAFIAATVRAMVVALFGVFLLVWTAVIAWRMSRTPGRRGASHRETLLMPMARDTEVGK